MPKSSVPVRAVIVAIFAALAGGFLLPTTQAQPPGFPGRPPGGFGAPGGITGAPGGVTGMPGRPPGAGISGMPSRPPGAGITGAGMGGPGFGGAGISGAGISGAGIGGMGGPGFGGGAGITTYSWSCSRCGASLGTTTTPTGSGHTRCPVCSAVFTGTSVAPGGGMPGAAPSRPPVMSGSAPAAPAPIPSSPAASSPPASPPAPAPFFPSVPAASSDGDSGDGAPAGEGAAAEPSGRSRTLKLIGIVCGSILLIGAIGALAVVVSNASSAKPTRRPRRRVIEDWRDRD